MKKLLPLLCLSLSIGAFAQNTMTIQVDNGNQLYQGVAVFLYEVPSVYASGTISDPKLYTQVAYTSGNGIATFTLAGDSAYYGTFDCNGNFYQGSYIFSPASAAMDTLTYSTCAPDFCDALLRNGQTGAGLEIEAVTLRDINFTGFNFSDHRFEVNNSFYQGTTASDNQTSLLVPNAALPVNGPVTILYTRKDSICNPVYDSTWYAGGGPSINCNASFFVDSINTAAFQGQLILQENSTTSAGSIIDYSWDMGDNSIYNTQYPIHTYAATAATYNICLTITAVDGADTCRSTFCMPVEFDSTGAPVLKNGFTVNVIDPATFSIDDPLLETVSLYPNPSKGEARLTWDATLDVQEVSVFTINGQQMMNLTPNSNEVMISSLPTGVYMVRIQTENAVTSQRLIVE
ncbi:MAG: T9SS type A sorting domain-containing protein [Flavobacteriia bacterium]|nr:T9SS type A sorting domain-containing protein [Flavobacteriia bacterium]